MAPGFPFSPAVHGSTPLLDRTAPLPPPVAPGSGARILVAIGFGLAAALAGSALLWHPPQAEELRAWILAQFEEDPPAASRPCT